MRTLNPKKESLQFLGMSKMKALEKGEKTTGIYRNFYKSQLNGNMTGKSKSQNLFPSKVYESDYRMQWLEESD